VQLQGGGTDCPNKRFPNDRLKWMRNKSRLSEVRGR